MSANENQILKRNGFLDSLLLELGVEVSDVDKSVDRCILSYRVAYFGTSLHCDVVFEEVDHLYRRFSGGELQLSRDLVPFRGVLLNLDSILITHFIKAE